MQNQADTKASTMTKILKKKKKTGRRHYKLHSDI